LSCMEQDLFYVFVYIFILIATGFTVGFLLKEYVMAMIEYFRKEKKI
jgi:hypothetical protein